MISKGRRFFFGDCTININPTAEDLAQIAINTANVARTFGYEPRVAMLSFLTLVRTGIMKKGAKNP